MYVRVVCAVVVCTSSCVAATAEVPMATARQERRGGSGGVGGGEVWRDTLGAFPAARWCSS